MPGPALSKRTREKHLHNHQHGHHHHDYHVTKVHSRLHDDVERAIDDAVTVTIDGNIVTWKNKYAGQMDKEEQTQADTRPHVVGDMVTATLDGNIVSWTNQYAGPSGTMPTQDAQVKSVPAESDVPQATTIAGQVHNPPLSPTEASIKAIAKTSAMLSTHTPVNLAIKASSMLVAQASKASAYFGNKASPMTSVKASFKDLAKPTVKSSAKASSTAAIGAPSGSWGRQAYYNAAQGHAEGLTFLNHYGNANDLPG